MSVLTCSIPRSHLHLECLADRQEPREALEVELVFTASVSTTFQMLLCMRNCTPGGNLTTARILSSSEVATLKFEVANVSNVILRTFWEMFRPARRKKKLYAYVAPSLKCPNKLSPTLSSWKRKSFVFHTMDEVSLCNCFDTRHSDVRFSRPTNVPRRFRFAPRGL